MFEATNRKQRISIGDREEDISTPLTWKQINEQELYKGMMITTLSRSVGYTFSR
jgi:hypothetical protein